MNKSTFPPSFCEVAGYVSILDYLRFMDFAVVIFKNSPDIRTVASLIRNDYAKGKQDLCGGDDITLISTHPKLSIIVTARNDNHGGELLKRIQLFVDGIFYLSTKFRLHTELIIVEWNPPQDNPTLATVIQWPIHHEFCSLRIIEVPVEVHQHFRNSEKLPLHQMIGKNVGIRRATGEFILVTNIDIIFSEQLFEKLGNGTLQKGRIYRTVRIDVGKDVPPGHHFAEIFSYFHENKIRVFHHLGTNTTPYTSACGDFQLMHRDDWFGIRGYWEFAIYPVHLDSILQYKAILSGMKEVTLSDGGMEIYHIDHIGSWSPQTEKDIIERHEKNEISSLSIFDLLTAIYCLKTESHLFMSDPDWGFKDVAFPERLKMSGLSVFSSTPNRIDDQLVKKQVNRITESTALGLQLLADSRIKMLTFDKKDFKQWMASFAPSRSNATDSRDNVQGKSMILFGTGDYYEHYVRPVLQHFSITPIAFIDNDPTKIGTYIDNVVVLSVQNLQKFKSNSIYILICSRYYMEKKAQLESWGYIETVDFSNIYSLDIHWEL